MTPLYLPSCTTTDDSMKGPEALLVLKLFAERILIGPKFLAMFGDDGHASGFFIVGFGEGPALMDGDAQGIEIRGRDHLYCTVGGWLSGSTRMTFDVHAIVSAHQPRGTVKTWAAERHRESHGDAIQFAIKCALRFLITDLLNVE